MTVIGDAPPVAVNPPTLDATVYVVIADPPLLAGGVNVTTASPFPTVAVPMVGASGAVAGTMEFVVPEEVLVPFAFVAVTVKLYVVPFERPVTVIGDDPPLALKPPTFEVTV